MICSLHCMRIDMDCGIIDERKLRVGVFEKRLFWRTFGPVTEEVTWDWKDLY